MEAGQSLIGLQRIVCDENSNAVLSVFVPHFGHDNAGRALLHGFADKIMTVKPLALEGYNNASLPMTRVSVSTPENKVFSPLTATDAPVASCISAFVKEAIFLSPL